MARARGREENQKNDGKHQSRSKPYYGPEGQQSDYSNPNQRDWRERSMRHSDDYDYGRDQRFLSPQNAPKRRQHDQDERLMRGRGADRASVGYGRGGSYAEEYGYDRFQGNYGYNPYRDEARYGGHRDEEARMQRAGMRGNYGKYGEDEDYGYNRSSYYEDDDDNQPMQRQAARGGSGTGGKRKSGKRKKAAASTSTATRNVASRSASSRGTQKNTQKNGQKNAVQKKNSKQSTARKETPKRVASRKKSTTVRDENGETTTNKYK